MKHSLRYMAVLIVFGASSLSRAAVEPQKLYEQVTPSLVAVQFQMVTETATRELVGAGVVVSDDGLIMFPIGLTSPAIPDEQMKDFKIILPSQDKDAEELEATFVGRDERSNIAFVKAKAKHDWKPIKFEEKPPGVGEPVYSVGLLSKAAAYKAYYMEGTVAVQLRGETPTIMVQGGLASSGSPVFDADGKAVGMVGQNTIISGGVTLFNGRPVGQAFIGSSLLLNDDEGSRDNLALSLAPRSFIPARDFLAGLNHPPTADQPESLPWMGIGGMRGLTKEVAEEFGLTNQPAVEISEVLSNTPAAKAGLVDGNIITKINGQPLERPDQPEELQGIINRQLMRMKVGDKVTFTILPAAKQPAKDVEVTLEERPMRANRAKRYFAEDLGFVVRELVFNDTYRQHMPADSKGIVVALLKPSGSAETAKLDNGDVITQMNGKSVTDLNQFKTDYEALRKDKPKDAVVLVVVRKFPSTESIRIEPPQ